MWLVQKKKFVAIGFNTQDSHSEVSAIREFKKMVSRKKIDTKDLKKGIWVYNLAYKVCSDNLSARISKPCSECAKYLNREKMVKKTFYTV